MVSKKTIHAIELCVLLAKQRGAGYLSTADLSPQLDLSVSYLENILKPLKDHGIVLSMRGPGGGYMIRGDVSLISVWDVASLFEPTFADAQPSDDTPAPAAFELELEQVAIHTLKSFTLSDFVDLSGAAVHAFTETIGRFKFKPLPAPFVPKAPNSVFQLGLSFQT